MPYEIINRFERAIAEYAGARYGVAVESCTAALFLCCKYLIPKKGYNIYIPRYTYPSVACSIIHAGGHVIFSDSWEEWKGIYSLYPYKIFDSALRFRKNMYIPSSYYCLSFHAKKQLSIGRGGMILTDDSDAVKWFKRMRFDGRNKCPLKEDNITLVGYNMYMTPEQAARGLVLFDLIKNKDLPDLSVEEQGYPDLSKIKVYGGENV